MTREEVNKIAFQIITNAGVSRSYYSEAYRKAKHKEFDEISDLIKQGDEMFQASHLLHANLIQNETSGENLDGGLILMHAEDQLMIAELAKQFVLEFIELRQENLRLEELINGKL